MFSRRKFIAATSFMSLGFMTAKGMPLSAKKNMLSHHVFFWLKNPGSEADRKKLITGLKTLSKIETVKALHIGVPAATAVREVIDASYDVSELIFFEDVKGQETYQIHLIHEQFVANCAHLWEKIVVYDSIEVEEP